MMFKSVVILLLLVISLLAETNEQCYSVKVVAIENTPENLNNLYSHTFAKECKVVFRDSLAKVMCGCYTTKDKASDRLSSLKKTYKDSYVTSVEKVLYDKSKYIEHKYIKIPSCYSLDTKDEAILHDVLAPKPCIKKKSGSLRCGCYEKEDDAKKVLRLLNYKDAVVKQTYKHRFENIENIVIPKDINITQRIVEEETDENKIQLVAYKENNETNISGEIKIVTPNKDLVVEDENISEESFKEKEQPKEITIDSIGLNLGYANINYKVGGDSSLVYNSPDRSYMHFELYLLISNLFNDNSYRPSLNYTFAKNQELSNHNLMVGISKYFYYKNYNLYAGVLAGAGTLQWNYTPLKYSKNEDFSAVSPVVALQTGTEYIITDTLLIGLNTKYYLHNFVASLTALNSNVTEVKHTNGFSVDIGVRYLFR